MNYLSAIVDARVFAPGEVLVLNGGEQAFTAQLAAIRAARRGIHLEVYLFLRGRVADEMLAALEAGLATACACDWWWTAMAACSPRSATSIG